MHQLKQLKQKLAATMTDDELFAELKLVVKQVRDKPNNYNRRRARVLGLELKRRGWLKNQREK